MLSLQAGDYVQVTNCFATAMLYVYVVLNFFGTKNIS